MESSSLGARASGKALSAGLVKRENPHYCYCRACISLAARGPHDTRPPAARAFVQKSCPGVRFPYTQVKRAAWLTFRSFAVDGLIYTYPRYIPRHPSDSQWSSLSAGHSANKTSIKGADNASTESGLGPPER